MRKLDENRLSGYLMILCILFCAVPVGAQDEHRNELVVKFTDSVIVMAPGEKTAGKEVIEMREDPRGALLYNSNLLEIRAMFKDRDPADSFAINQFGDTIMKPRFDNYFKIVYPDTASCISIYDSLSQLEGIIDAYINGSPICDGLLTPNDPWYPGQWNLHFDSSNSKGISVEGAWQYTVGDSDIIIAVIDPEGIRTDHVELSGRVIGDTDYGGYHGTAVAGIIMAKTNNDTLVAGICQNGMIYSGRIDDDYESTANTIINAVDMGAHILNNSWGQGNNVHNFVGVIRAALAYAYKMNRVVVCSKGNDGSGEVHYPSDYGWGIVSVGSYNYYGYWSLFSNTGHAIDVVAPGESNLSLLLASSPDGISSFLNPGTSWSAPHVSGLAGLLLSYNNSLCNDDIEHIIKYSAIDIEESPALPGYDDYTGYGRINALSAFELLQPPNYLEYFEEGNGYVHSISDVVSMTFVDIPGLTDGIYYAKIYQIRKNVHFPQPYSEIPYVWGRGTSSIGYNDESFNCGMGFTGVLTGSETETGCTVGTYVYEVWTISGAYKGWFPTTPSGVRFAYTVLGKYNILASEYISCSRDYNDQCIKVSIEDPNHVEDGWIIERKDATNNTWEVIDSLPENESDFILYRDFYPVGSETYTYRARPYKLGYPDIAYTDEFTITARPNRPENVDAFTTDYGGIVPLGGMMCGFGLESIPEIPDTLEEPLPHLYGNDITVIWSPPQNQKLPIVSYVVKRRMGVSPPNYVENVGLDTIFYKCPNSYNTGYTMEVYAIDSNGDTSLCASDGVQTGTTNTCPGTPTKESDYVVDIVPLEFELQQNYPNPFNLNTTIAFSLPAESNVKLEIFDILGRKIKTLINENYIQGTHSIDWDGRDYTGRIVSSGVYFCRIESACGIKTLKMLLIK